MNCWDPDMRESMGWMLMASAWLLAVASCGLKRFREALAGAEGEGHRR
jgi:hypothetical protein